MAQLSKRGKLPFVVERSFCVSLGYYSNNTLTFLRQVRIHATLVSPAAGKALAVTLCWISIAACLIVDTWRINFPREHFYPRRLPNGSSQTGFSWGVLGGTPSETK
mgnify:CR=1 FL=1